MIAWSTLGFFCGVVLILATLRHVYAVGQGLNDHAVSVVVVGTMAFYVLLLQNVSSVWGLALIYGQVGVWGLFFSIHRDEPPGPLVEWCLARPSQLCYAFAFWGWVCWGLRLPWVVFGDAQAFAPGLWLFPAFAMALLGTLQTYMSGGEVRRHKVKGLNARVVHLSDLHASAVMHTPEFGRLVRDVNVLRPELVLITGDLVMPFSEKEHGYLVDALSAIDAPVYCCPGNHDLPILKELKLRLEAAGIRMLVDERDVLTTATGQLIELTGVNFYWEHARDRLDAVMVRLPDAPVQAFRILLAHDPRLGAWVPHARFDLVLSGHTHGGQIAGNMFGLAGSVLRVLGVRDQGWWEANGGLQYVHRGNWFTGLPPRMGVAGEIALFLPDLDVSERMSGSSRGATSPFAV